MNASSTSSTPQSPDLRHLSGPLVLVGAGKMGGALLDGWLRFGLDPANVAVIEPQPSPHISALADRGVRLNPDAGRVGRAAAIVIAVKPQVAA
jgi:pyrroline-5-carboxylate reductase